MPEAKKLLQPGESATWFAGRTATKPSFHFDTIAGQYIVLCFFQSAGLESSKRLLAQILQRRALFDDENLAFFGVSTDAIDELQSRVADALPGVRYFWDFDRAISRLYGAAPVDPAVIDASLYRRVTYVLDERLRAVATLPFQDDPDAHAARLFKILDSLPPLAPPCAASIQAPVLVVPRILEPEICRKLIGYYEQHGGKDSRIMREVSGKTVEVHD